MPPESQRAKRHAADPGGLEHLHLMDPLDYQSLVQLMKASSLILTDSAAFQEEAPGLGVAGAGDRDTTERPEGVDAGVVKLVGTNRGAIVAAATELLSDESARQKMITGANPYGDGRAANGSSRPCGTFAGSLTYFAGRNLHSANFFAMSAP